MNRENELIPDRMTDEVQDENSPYIQETVPNKKKAGFGIGILVGVGSTLLIVAIIAVVAAVIIFTIRGGDSVVDTTTNTKVDYITGLLRKYYYEDVDDEDLEEGVYKGIVEGVDDPYTEYYTAEEYQSFLINTTGKYGGIGAQLSKNADTGEVSVVKVYDGTPAKEAGLKKDDIIISADGTEGTSLELDKFVQIIRGEEGTSVEIVYSRDGKENTISVKRENITLPSVSHQMLEGNVGLIEISEFTDNTKDEFDEAISDLQSQDMQAVIFDLRSNPGGLVDSVTEILDEILPEGTTVYMLDKEGEKTTYTSDGEHYLDYPMVVLTSENTASAAEIFSGAIRDFEYGTLIGKKTYGKGVVQSTFPLTDGSAVKITIARYYTPSGECIHEKGIEPDIELDYEYTGDENSDEYDYMADNQVVRALEELQK